MHRVGLISLFMLISGEALADCKTPGIVEKLNHEVIRLKHADSHAQDYRDGRKYFSISFDGGTNNGCIVYHAIEGWGGSNAVSEYLSFFYVTPERAVLRDTIDMRRSPWRQYRQIDFDVPPTVEKNVLSVAIKLYAKGDGACCPSIPGISTFAFKNKHLVELRSPRSNLDTNATQH